MLLYTFLTVLLTFLPLISGSVIDRRDAKPAAVAAAQPAVTPRTPTPSRYEATRTLKNRGIISDLAGDTSSILGSLGSDIPSYVASGVPNFFQGTLSSCSPSRVILTVVNRFPHRCGRAEQLGAKRQPNQRAANAGTEHSRVRRLDRPRMEPTIPWQRLQNAQHQ